MSSKHAFIMMIKEKYWHEFLFYDRGGKKTHSYVQKGAAPPKDAHMIFFYVTKPVGELAGSAEIIERKVGEADEMWKEYGHESVLNSKEQFEEFIKDHQKASFIRFTALHEARRPLPLSSILKSLGLKSLSRKGFYIDKESSDRLLASMQ